MGVGIEEERGKCRLDCMYEAKGLVATETSLVHPPFKLRVWKAFGLNYHTYLSHEVVYRLNKILG